MDSSTGCSTKQQGSDPMFRFVKRLVAPASILLVTSLLIVGTPTKANGCPKKCACPAEFYPYTTLIDDQVYCNSDNLQHISGRNWVFHCCTGNESPNLDLYITMPDDSVPSDKELWEAGQVD